MRNKLVLVLRLLLAALFIFAAYTKLKQSYLIFAMTIDAYDLIHPEVSRWVARLLPPFELALGAALLLGWRLRWTSLITAALALFFLGILFVTYSRGLTIDCGCFGVGEPLTAKTLARDGALAGAAVLLAWLAWRGPSAAAISVDGAGSRDIALPVLESRPLDR